MTHQLLLHAHRSTYGIEPSAVGVAHRMCADPTDSRGLRSLLIDPPHLVVGPRQPAYLDRGGKEPRSLMGTLRRASGLSPFGWKITRFASQCAQFASAILRNHTGIAHHHEDVLQRLTQERHQLGLGNFVEQMSCGE